MTHFEYISVAVALILSLVVARLLSGVSAATDPRRAYWIHLCWLGQSLIAVVVLWWGFWNTRQGEWTAVRFAWALLAPALMYVKAHLLVGPSPESIVSFRDHFFQTRARFFSVGLLLSLVIALNPLIHGEATCEEILELLPLMIMTIAINATGFFARSLRVQAPLSVIALSFSLAALFMLPTSSPDLSPVDRS